jgi:hypothetical protein
MIIIRTWDNCFHGENSENDALSLFTKNHTPIARTLNLFPCVCLGRDEASDGVIFFIIWLKQSFKIRSVINKTL